MPVDVLDMYIGIWHGWKATFPCICLRSIASQVSGNGIARNLVFHMPWRTTLVHGALQICMMRYHALISAPVPPGEGMFTAQMR